MSQPKTLEAWARVARAGYDAHLFRCANCGHETTDAADIAMELCVVDPGPRRRHRHACKNCGAPLPWCDERDYLHCGDRP